MFQFVGVLTQPKGKTYHVEGEWRHATPRGTIHGWEGDIVQGSHPPFFGEYALEIDGKNYRVKFDNGGWHFKGLFQHPT